MKKLEVNKNGKISGFGEVMLRFTTPDFKKISQSTNLDVNFGGAEFNVINSLSNFNHATKYTTALPNNPFGQIILKQLNSNLIDTSAIVFSEGRLGQYFLEQGFGARGSNVIYDRKYSCFSLSEKNTFDYDKILEDTCLLHISGISPALSENLREFTLELAKKATEKNIIVSYDSNYRSKLWSIDEAATFTQKILKYVDIAFLGILDMKNILKYDLDFDEKSLPDLLQEGYTKLFKDYPQLKLTSCTSRTVHSINNNDLQGFVFDGENLHASLVYNFDILDRVGGGDAFSAGILHKIVNNDTFDNTVEFGTAASVLKHSIKGDVNMMSEQEIQDFIDKGLQNIVR